MCEVDDIANLGRADLSQQTIYCDTIYLIYRWCLTDERAQPMGRPATPAKRVAPIAEVVWRTKASQFHAGARWDGFTIRLPGAFSVAIAAMSSSVAGIALRLLAFPAVPCSTGTWLGHAVARYRKLL
jgi:hypothetical protein